MLTKILIFAILLIIYIGWYAVLLSQKKSTSHLLLSFVVTCIPIQMSIPIFTPLYITEAETGSFTSKVFLTLPLIISLILIIKNKNKNLLYFYKNETWVWWIVLLILISIFNPHNFAVWATIAFAVFFLSYILFFRIIYNSLTPIEVLNGIFSSFVLLGSLQFILAILYPLLGVSFVTTIFQAGGELWSTRDGQRPGAIGVFVTPANLGLFSVILSGFFTSTFLNGFKKKISLLLLGINVITIFLTYSRTSYITLILVTFALIYINKNAKKSLISIKSIFLGIIPTLLVLYWIIFYSPLSATFLKTNADEMYQARVDHWYMGLEIFKLSPIVGVGINTHLEFVNHISSLYNYIHNEFLTTNPIHNTHLIILAETGVIGFSLWIIFIFYTFIKAKHNLAQKNNVIFSSTMIAVLIIYIIYGFTDWAPLSLSTFPIFLLFTFFDKKYSL
jgi:O-antigen ligase